MRRAALVCLLTWPVAAAAAECRVLNVQRFASTPPASRTWVGDRGQDLARSGVAWFGAFSKNGTYGELRAGYDAEGLDLHLFVADFYVWWVLSDGVQWGGKPLGNPEQWDALEVSIDPAPLEGPPASAPSSRALRLLLANYPYNDPVLHPETGEAHLATRTWSRSAGGWSQVADPRGTTPWYHEVSSAWQNTGPNDNGGDYDLSIHYHLFIPWAALGVTAEPPSGGTLRMRVRALDVDDPRDADCQNGLVPSQKGSTQVGPLPPVVWPAGSLADDASTWATVVLNQAPYRPPAVSSEQTVTLAPQDVPGFMDTSVGGHAFILDRWTRGGGAASDYAWESCMDTRFGTAGDLIVHPESRGVHLCFFSRSLFFFDLTGHVAPQQAVRRATLRLFHFGGDTNENPGTPGFDVATSHVQVHRIEHLWRDLPLDAGVTWNTLGEAAENAGIGTVTPDLPAGQDGKFVTIDVTPLVARAVRRAEPVNLALYGADPGANTGKYFASSETTWPAERKPSLTVVYGAPLDAGALPPVDVCTVGVSTGFFVTEGTGSPASPGTPVTPDAGGPPLDAGPPPSDAGLVPDAGGADAGPTPLAQDDNAPAGGACGCHAGPELGLGALALLLVARRRASLRRP